MANGPAPTPSPSPTGGSFSDFLNGGAAGGANTPQTLDPHILYPTTIDAGLDTTTFIYDSGPRISSGVLSAATGGQGGGAPGGPITYNAGQWLQQFGAMSPSSIAQWQHQLVAAGLLTPGKFTPGYADDATMSAVEDAMVESFRQNQGLLQVLQARTTAQSQANQQALGQKTTVKDITVTNTNDLNTALDTAYQKVLGRKATDAEKAAFASSVQGQEAGNQSARYDAQINAQRSDVEASLQQVENPTEPTASGSSGSPAGIEQFMQALSGQESGGSYGATNSTSGASGKYQIMPGNWSEWAKEAGLSANAPQTPENQEIVARAKIASYYQEFGNWADVAKAWYGGEHAPKLSQAAQNAPQPGGPSINGYAASVMQRMGQPGSIQDQVTAATPYQTITTQTAGSPSSQAEDYARQQNPVQAGGHDLADAFSNFMTVLGGIK